MKRCPSTGKQSHATRDGACIVVRKMKNVQLNVYPCGDCKGWHVGNSRSPFRLNQRLDQILGRKPPRIDGAKRAAKSPVR